MWKSWKFAKRWIVDLGGALQAFDSREDNSNSSGHLGGLLQSSTYLAGLSGGGWLVGSIFLNNFTSITGLLNDDKSSVWEFGNSIFEGPVGGGVQLVNTVQYFDEISDDVSAKSDAGFNRSITDYWGRALSYQLIGAESGGPAYTWSSIALEDKFVSGDTPMPLLVADGRGPDTKLVGVMQRCSSSIRGSLGHSIPPPTALLRWNTLDPNSPTELYRLTRSVSVDLTMLDTSWAPHRLSSMHSW